MLGESMIFERLRLGARLSNVLLNTVQILLRMSTCEYCTLALRDP